MKILRHLAAGLFIGAYLSSTAWALPEGANVTQGSVHISNSGSTQTIQQGSQRAIINWNGFNIDVGELVNIVQPSSISALLNRVVGQDPSVILGALRSNGQVFLVNPNGVLFGPSAQINVGSLVASTLNITDDDFLAGNLNFAQSPDKALASVINQGTIKVDDHGFVVLSGPMVANEGLILARVGQVALAGGQRNTVSFDPSGMIQVALPAGSEAQPGVVSLTREATSDVLASVVTTFGKPAGRMVTRDGRTFLEVDSGTAINTGQILAEGADGQRGGKVVMDSAAHTLLAPGSLVSVAGQGLNSASGEVYVLSDGQGTTSDSSRIDASGSGGGDGGFIEHSARYGRIGAQMKLSSDGGKGGTLLIDPSRIVVLSGNGGALAPVPKLEPDGDPEGILYWTEYALEGIPAGTISLEASDGIHFEALNVAVIPGPGELTIQEGVNLNISLTRLGGDGTPAVTFADPNDRIRLLGGNFSLDNNTGQDVHDLEVVTASGYSITIDNSYSDEGFRSNLLSPSSGRTLFSGGDIIIYAGNVGTESNPVQLDGNVTLEADDAFIRSLGSVVLAAQVSNDLIADGANFSNMGMYAANNIVFALTGDLNQVMSGSSPLGTVQANSVNISAGRIGAVGAPLSTMTRTLTLSANNGIRADNSYEPGSTNVSLTNLSASASTVLTGGGGALLSDLPVDSLPGVITINGPFQSANYTTVGNRALNITDTSSDLRIATTGALTTGTAGGVNRADNLELDAGSIDLDFGLDNANGTLTARATGNIDITGPLYQLIATSSGGDVSFNGELQLLSANAARDVIVTSAGDIIIQSVDAGRTARLTADRNIQKDGDFAYVRGNSVRLEAGGTITPGAPLEIRDATTIYVSAADDLPAPPPPVARMILAQAPPAAPTAASLTGPSLPSGTVIVTVGPDSGPVLYNGQLITGTNGGPPPPPPSPPTPPAPPTPDPTPDPVPPIDPIPTDPVIRPEPPTPVPEPPVVPDTPVIPDPPVTPDNPVSPDVPITPESPVSVVMDQVANQLGQQAGQVVDDGATGSAANDPLVEQSATQQLVARLTDTANSNAGLTTDVLISLAVDELGEVKVSLAETGAAAPDVRIDQAEDLRANDLIDLDSGELGDVGVSLFYDPAKDQLVMSINLRADQVLDLDVSELVELPVDVSYRFLSDPKVISDALRANDIIDFEVEDLGEIPIRVVIQQDDSKS